MDKDRTIYLKAEQCVKVSNKTIYLEDVVTIYGDDKNLVKELNKEVLIKMKDEEKDKFIFSILKIIDVIKAKHSNVEINNLGETDIIVEYTPPEKKRKVLEYTKLIFVCLSVFFGSAFTIMTFNEDVSVGDVFTSIYELIKSEPQQGGGILEISYAIGLPLGIAIFFNHFSRFKLNSDPTPLQVELRVYEEEVNKAMIQNASREGNEIDV